MPFPEDLSDILPLLPGTSVTRRISVFDHIVYVEIAHGPDGYRLTVYDYHEGRMRRLLTQKRLTSESLIEDTWQGFRCSAKSIFSE